MSRERILAIALDVHEALDRAPDWCATLEAKDDEEKWVQFVDGVINPAYPDPGRARQTDEALDRL
jgi:hypothetical protein